MSELKWNWAYLPYLDPPEKQKESAQNAGYVKVVSKDGADKVIAEKDEKIRRLRKALLLVCAKRADAEAHIEHNLADLLLKGQTCKSVDFHRLERDKWYKRAVSCRAKAEECK